MSDEMVVAKAIQSIEISSPSIDDLESQGVEIALPDEHLTIIQRRPGWQIFDLDEIWRFRELLYFLVWRDVKVRYKQTFLGAAWAILQPFAQMVVFSIFFGKMANLPSAGIPYPLFAFAGLVPWTFFSTSIATAANSLINSQNMVTKVYFPRLFVPVSAIGVGLVDLAIAYVLLLFMMIGFGVMPGLSILMTPVIILFLAVATIGIGALLSALTVSYRDFRYVVPFLVQLWMFATPAVFMDATYVGPRWQAALPFNPAYGLILNFRNAAMGIDIDWYALSVSLAVTIGIFLFGCFYFRKVESRFADVI